MYRQLDTCALVLVLFSSFVILLYVAVAEDTAADEDDEI